MAEFSLHVRLDATQARRVSGEDILTPYVEEHDEVTFGAARVDTPASDDVVVPDRSSLDIEGLDIFAKVYADLRTHPAVQDLHLWGPDAERFPVPVQHYALQQIQQPDSYEYHALDDQVTLVVAESEMEAQLVRRNVPDGALGYSQSPL